MNIITLTLNPAIDKSASVDELVAEQKLNCHNVQYQPGGGGINVSRVLQRLGVKSKCIFPVGGYSGSYFKKLLNQENIDFTAIEIKDNTRENFSVFDAKSALQYRFGMPGNTLSESELLEIEKTMEALVKEGDILVLSGSLGIHMPNNYYAYLIRKMTPKKIKVILDTAGLPLIEALKENIFLIKPNQRELAQLARKEFLSQKEQKDFALDLVKSGKVEFVVVSLGAKGAFIASASGILSHKPPLTDVKSTVGAGDSMVAGLVLAIQKNYTPQEMLTWGMACGVATTMSEGTNLAQKETIMKVYKELLLNY